MTARFSDLSTAPPRRLPPQGEQRARDWWALVQQHTRPVARLRDDAPDRNGQTLTGLKRLLAGVADGAGRWSIVRAGHPTRRHDLRRPTMAASGYGPAVLRLDGIAGRPRASSSGLLDAGPERPGAPQTLLTPAARDRWATTRRTPWPSQLHLPRALDVGDQAGEPPLWWKAFGRNSAMTWNRR